MDGRTGHGLEVDLAVAGSVVERRTAEAGKTADIGREMKGVAAVEILAAGMAAEQSQVVDTVVADIVEDNAAASPDTALVVYTAAPAVLEDVVSNQADELGLAVPIDRPCCLCLTERECLDKMRRERGRKYLPAIESYLYGQHCVIFSCGI